LETKFEYQLPLELAEKIASEQSMIQTAGLQKKRWYLPILLGIIGAAILGSGDSKCQIGSNDYSTAARMIDAIIGFFLGFGLGCLFHKSVRSKIVSRAREQARVSHKKLGTSRTVSWDAEWINISTAVWKTQIKWLAIDDLRNEPIGIHLMYCGQSIFGFPKVALPTTVTADNLIKIWQNCLVK
jgi:uncharacterized membrane protein YeaQ/YmgE (transglycosylase-associated protein family)